MWRDPEETARFIRRLPKVSPPRPFPQCRLLGPDEPAPEGATVWAYAGTLERFSGGEGTIRYRQRIAWPAGTPWEHVRDLGLWMVERLSINGYILLGLRAWEDGEPPEAAQRIFPDLDNRPPGE